MTPETLKQFLLDLDAQHALYQRMADQTRAQIQRLAGVSDASELGAMLAEKQVLMHELEQLESRLSPQKQGWPAEKAQLPATVVEFADARMAALQVALRALIEAEDSASQLIQQRLLGNREKLAGLTRKSAASKAYAENNRPAR